MKIVIGWIVFVSLFTSGCQPGELKDHKAYISYLVDPKNGLIKEKNVGGICYTIRYMPSHLLAFNQAGAVGMLSSVSRDSLVRQYEQSLTFVIHVGPAQGEDFDVMRLGVRSYAEFAERMERFAFKAQDWVSIETPAGTTSPVIARMENVNAFERGRNFVVVFASEKGTTNDLRRQDLVLCYDDQLFNTGVNKFTFKASDMEAVPVLRF